MRTIVSVLAACALLVLFTRTTWAGQVVTFEFTNGTEKTAEVERVVDSGNEPYFVVLVGGQSTNFFFHQLKPSSVHRAWTAIAENDDVATHIAIGAYCSEHGLTEEAVRELTEAREIAEKLERRARDMLVASRKEAAASLFREAKQQETLQDMDAALKLYARIWSDYHWDAEDIRNEVEAAIRSLATPTHADEILKKIRQPRPAGNANGNAGNGGNNANGGNGANNGGAGNPAVNPGDQLDDQSEFRSAQKSKYRRTLGDVEQAEGKLKSALAELAEARRLEIDGADDASARLYSVALGHLIDVREVVVHRIIGGTAAEDWAWMPLLRRKADGIVTQLDRDLLAVSRARMHYYARRAPDHPINMANAEKWCNSVLALRPTDDEALRVRMKLTELALERK